MGLPIRLTNEERATLVQAHKALARARQDAELVVTRARALVLEAEIAKRDLVDQLATVYGFDADRDFVLHDDGSLTWPEPSR